MPQYNQSWREISAEIIARVILECAGDEARLKAALYDAYPFGRRKRLPYKIWLSEIKRQVKAKSPPPAGQDILF